MKISTQHLLMLLAASGMFISACGKDFNTDDYKTERLQKNLAKIRGAEGTYSGIATSKIDGQPLGALQISMKAVTSVIANPTDESDQSAQPNLQATVTFTGPSMAVAVPPQTGNKKPPKPNTTASDNLRMQIVAQNGHYDVDSNGAYNADITINRVVNGTAKTDTISLDGQILNGHYVGHIYSKDTPTYGAAFDLVLNGPPAEDLLKQQKISTDRFSKQANYNGGTNFAVGGTKPVVLILLNPPTTTPSEDEFISLLVPRKSLVATLNYGNGARLSFTNATLDMTTGELTGTATVNQLFPDQTLQTLMSLNCTKLGAKDEFECDMSSGGSSGVVATTHVKKGGKDSPTDTDSRKLTNIVYSGMANWLGSASTPVCLSVIYAARTRLQEIFDLVVPTAEKTLSVTWVEPKVHNTGTAFSTVKWDGLNGTLDANQPMSLPNGVQGNVILSCQSFFFYFDKKDSSFSCTYTATVGNVNGTFTFEKGAAKKAISPTDEGNCLFKK